MEFDINRPLPVQAFGLNMDLFPGQTYEVEASVNATVSSINCTTADSSCWMPEVFFASPHAWASTLNVSGTIKFTNAANDAHQEVLFVSAYDELADPPTNFTSNLIGFNVYRGNCTGLWQIGESGASLQQAIKCRQSEFPTSRDVIRKNKTFRSLQNNLQQVLADAMVQVVNGPPLQIIPKDMSIQSAIIASLIWIKLSIDGTDLAFFLKYSELHYETRNYIQSTIPTMKPEIRLYLVICIQPVIIIISMIMRSFFTRTLVSRGFGLTSFLAGITHESITLIRGATYNGSLTQSVKVTMQVIDDGKIHGHPSGHLGYILDTDRRVKSGSLVKGVTYK